MNYANCSYKELIAIIEKEPKNTQAFDAFYVFLAPNIYVIAQKIMTSGTKIDLEASDLIGHLSLSIVQFRKNQELAQRFPTKSKFFSFAFTVMKNLMRTRLRRKYMANLDISVVDPAEYSVDDANIGFDIGFEDKDLLEKGLKILAKFGKRYKRSAEMINARYLEDREYSEIAKKYNKSENAVRGEVSHGIRKLKKIIERLAPNVALAY